MELDIYRPCSGELQRGHGADFSGSRVAPKSFECSFEISYVKKGPLRGFLTSPSVSAGLPLSLRLVRTSRFNEKNDLSVGLVKVSRMLDASLTSRL